jgi:EAL domain-containing protein (putative c-di-GMP-specific phosphodiesterase class I)
MTRTWEIDDGKGALPMDLVREQDFILRVRRLQRLGTPHLIVNLILNAVTSLAKNRRILEDVQSRLKDFAKITNGTYAEMSNGDAFIIWEETGDAPLLAARLISFLPVEEQANQSSETVLLTFHMPRDYTPLRERTNHYIEVVRASNSLHSDAPADALKSESARGPLTAWGVDQIGKLLDDIDVRTYGRTQPIYRIDAQDIWSAIAEEYFISFEALRRERFPKLDLITPEHLFFALCEMLDLRLLTALSDTPATIAGRTLHFNLSVATVIGSVFTRFTHSVPREKRGLLTFELHRGDLFQDFSRTLNAIDILHHEGFKVSVDSVTPDMLPYINLPAFKLDYVKINVSGDRIGALSDAAVRKGLLQLPADKIIFFRCDSDKALLTGRELGIKLFQGWHIDDIATHGKPPAHV